MLSHQTCRMLTGKLLGEAIKIAIDRKLEKGVKKSDLARRLVNRREAALQYLPVLNPHFHLLI